MTLSAPSIVVLPFVNFSPDAENEYFSDGITEEIINALTRVEGLKVIARTSAFAFKGKNLDVRDIGRQLGVTSILEGSIRKAGNRVRITGQLINAEDGTHYWSQNFDRELQDIFAVQDEISLLIAEQIRENFGHLEIQEHLVKPSTNSVTAYEHFLEGRHQQLQWTADSISNAIRCYDRAIANDPKFARAYFGNLQCYGLLAAWGYMPSEEGFAKAIENFRIGQDLDKKLPEYTMSFVGKAFWQDWNFQVAYDFLQKTLEIDPHYTDALEGLAELMIAHGKFTEAEKYARKSLEVDPLSANHHYTMGYIHYRNHQFDKAMEWVEKALTLRADFDLAVHLKAQCLIFRKEEAAFDSLVAPLPEADLLRKLYSAIHQPDLNLPEEKVTEWANLWQQKQGLVPYELFILANSGREKEAFTLLQKLVEQRRGQIINFKFEPFLETLHALPGFAELHVSNLEIPEIVSEEKSKSEPKYSTAELDQWESELTAHFEAEQPYLDPQLTLSQLAKAIDLHPNRLSYLINERKGSNFNELINYHRLAHFKIAVLAPENKHLSLLE